MAQLILYSGRPDIVAHAHNINSPDDIMLNIDDIIGSIDSPRRVSVCVHYALMFGWPEFEQMVVNRLIQNLKDLMRIPAKGEYREYVREALETIKRLPSPIQFTLEYPPRAIEAVSHTKFRVSGHDIRHNNIISIGPATITVTNDTIAWTTAEFIFSNLGYRRATRAMENAFRRCSNRTHRSHYLCDIEMCFDVSRQDDFTYAVLAKQLQIREQADGRKIWWVNDPYSQWGVVELLFGEEDEILIFLDQLAHEQPFPSHHFTI